jgi:hypothetical protein
VYGLAGSVDMDGWSASYLLLVYMQMKPLRQQPKRRVFGARLDFVLVRVNTEIMTDIWLPLRPLGRLPATQMWSNGSAS